MTQHPPPTKHKTSETSENSSHDLAFTLLQDRLSMQFDQVDTLDAKANAAQVSASTLVGAALVLQAVLLGGSSTLLHRLFQVVVLVPLLVAYAFVMYYASKGYSVKGYEHVPAPSMLLQHLDMAESELKRTLLHRMEKAFTDNAKKIDEKKDAINRANLALKIETGVLIVVLLAQTILPYFLD